MPVWLAADGLDIGVFAQYGVLGVVAFIGIVFARTAYRRETARADRLEDENRRLNEMLQDKVIPALGSATRAAEESAVLLSAMHRERENQQLLEQERRLRREDPS